MTHITEVFSVFSWSTAVIMWVTTFSRTSFSKYPDITPENLFPTKIPDIPLEKSRIDIFPGHTKCIKNLRMVDSKLFNHIQSPQCLSHLLPPQKSTTSACKTLFYSQISIFFLISLNSVSYHCFFYCTTLNICVCHLFSFVVIEISHFLPDNCAPSYRAIPSQEMSHPENLSGHIPRRKSLKWQPNLLILCKLKMFVERNGLQSQFTFLTTSESAYNNLDHKYVQKAYYTSEYIGLPKNILVNFYSQRQGRF